MIQRKDSLGFMDIMRGKYKLNEPDYICKQIHGMTVNERQRLLNDDFDKIWNDLWGSDFETSHKYAHNRITSKHKLSELRKGVTNANGDMYTLADLLRREPAIYETPEWGFPKGRRELYETDSQCAFREVEEETGISESDLWKALNVAPLIEQFYGSNNINYRHTYYIAQYIGHDTIGFDKLNTDMTREIGNLAWKSLDEGLVILRPENVEKRGILIQLANILRNFTPVIFDVLHGEKTENKEVEQQEEYVFTSRSNTAGSRTARAKSIFNSKYSRSDTRASEYSRSRGKAGSNYTSRSNRAHTRPSTDDSIPANSYGTTCTCSTACTCNTTGSKS
jgi:8-oxo-dGTP pyrophosphatase MutT (NUDIX family)